MSQRFNELMALLEYYLDQGDTEMVIAIETELANLEN